MTDDEQSQKLLTITVEIAKFVQNFLDSNIDPISKAEYFPKFLTNIRTNIKTNSCLILQGCYDLPIFAIHTPVGVCQVTSGKGTGPHRKLRKQLMKNLGLKMICPGYQTNFDYHGPYWLITSFNNQPIPYSNLKLLPDHDDLDMSIEKECWKIINPYIKQKRLFYK